MTDPDHASWVRAALDRHERPLLRFAASFVGAGQAQDVVQETFLKLCQQERASIEGHLAAWLFRVTRNRCLDVLRHGGRHQDLGEDDMMQSPDSGPGSKVERRQTLTQLKAVIERLPERQRQAVLLKFDAGLSYKEIASVMETSVSNVGVTLHTALKKVRAELDGHALPVQPGTLADAGGAQ